MTLCRSRFGWAKPNVRYWHLADMPSCTAHVRFWGKSGHDVLHCKCPLMTHSGHWGRKVLAFEPCTRRGPHGGTCNGGRSLHFWAVRRLGPLR